MHLLYRHCQLILDLVRRRHCSHGGVWTTILLSTGLMAAMYSAAALRTISLQTSTRRGRWAHNPSISAASNIVDSLLTSISSFGDSALNLLLRQGISLSTRIQKKTLDKTSTTAISLTLQHWPCPPSPTFSCKSRMPRRVRPGSLVCVHWGLVC